MKLSIIYLMIAFAVACNDQKRAAVKNFIPGVYARSVVNECSEGQDTLVIQALGGDVYAIEHRTGYQRIIDGKKGVVETKREHWTALYDNQQNLLKETKRGRVLFFSAEKNILFVGNSPYQKLASIKM